MTMYSPIIEELNLQQRRDAIRDRVQFYLPQWQPRPAGDSRLQAVYGHADEEHLLLAHLNQRVHAQTFSGSSGADVDDYAARFGITRNGRTDDELKAAIVSYTESSQAGTIEFTDRVIRAVSGSIFDWSHLIHDPTSPTTTPPAGTVRIYILSSDHGSALFGTPTATLRTAVQTALNADTGDDAKIISDTFAVAAPTITEYRVEVTITGGQANAIASRLRGYAQTLTRLGQGVTAAGYIRATLNAGASNATVTLKQGDGSALAGGAVDLAPVANAAYAVRDANVTVS